VPPSSSVPDAVVQAAERLAPARVTAIAELRKGGNSRVFKVATAAGAYALKKYPADDTRDRQGAEARALAFFARAGIEQTPCLVAADTAVRASLLSWVEGTAPTDVSDADVAEFARFQIALDRAIDAPSRRDIGPAAEACISGTRILSHIAARHGPLAALSKELPQLAQFLQSRFVPALTASEQRARRIYGELGLDFAADRAAADLTLIASDFGAHNALRTPDGLVFLDFEYFGWDDPLTSMGNFVFHPGMQLTPAQRRLYQDTVLAHFGTAHAQRLSALLPLFALRWCAIVLSELLPERQTHRGAANATIGDRSEILVRQLAKADRLLQQIDQP
jgi:Phosphotransferase enzyme family